MTESLRHDSEESGRGALRRRFEAIERALDALLPFFRRWAHGRLPRFARRRMDTGDVVQEAIVGVLRNLGKLDGADQETLKRYLTVAIQNRICDEVRRSQIGEVANGGSGCQPDTRPSPHDEAVEEQHRRQYREALLRLGDDDRRLLVGRIELGLSYPELALATGRPSAEAARAAARRAALRLARFMGPAPPAGSATDPTPPGEAPGR